MSTPDDAPTSTPTDALSGAAAHLQSAVDHADAAARADNDPLLSPWANTAQHLDVAAAGLRLHLPGPVPASQHPHCLSAVRAASTELGRLRPGVDVPLADLAQVMAHLAPALHHVQAHAAAQSEEPSPPQQYQHARDAQQPPQNLRQLPSASRAERPRA